MFEFQVTGGACPLFFFATQLISFDLDVDIELLGDDNVGVGNRFFLEQNTATPLQSSRNSFNTNTSTLTRANADAINLLNNEFINIGDDEPEFINYEECDSEDNSQCRRYQQPYGYFEERVIGGVALKWANEMLCPCTHKEKTCLPKKMLM